MSGTEFFAWLAMSGIVVGPYLIYEAESFGKTIGWTVTAISLIVLGFIGWPFVKGDISIFGLQPPALLPFFVAALSVAISLSLIHEYRSDLYLKDSAQQFAAAIAAFANECATRNTPTLTDSQRLEERHWEWGQFYSRFAPGISQINRAFTARGLSTHEVADSLLDGNTFYADVTVPLAAKTLAGLALRLPHYKKWIRESLLTRVALYISAAGVLWLSLFMVQRHYGETLPATAEADLRLAPFSSDSRFFSDLPVNPEQSFKILCFPFDPMSCNIAARYRDHLADHWTPDGAILFDYDNPATFKGISIVTQSEKRPSGALSLRAQFRSLGIDPAFPTVDPSKLKLESNEFAIWIGGQP